MSKTPIQPAKNPSQKTGMFTEGFNAQKFVDDFFAQKNSTGVTEIQKSKLIRLIKGLKLDQESATKITKKFLESETTTPAKRRGSQTNSNQLKGNKNLHFRSQSDGDIGKILKENEETLGENEKTLEENEETPKEALVSNYVSETSSKVGSSNPNSQSLSPQETPPEAAEKAAQEAAQPSSLDSQSAEFVASDVYPSSLYDFNQGDGSFVIVGSSSPDNEKNEIELESQFSSPLGSPKEFEFDDVYQKEEALVAFTSSQIGLELADIYSSKDLNEDSNSSDGKLAVNNPNNGSQSTKSGGCDKKFPAIILPQKQEGESDLPSSKDVNGSSELGFSPAGGYSTAYGEEEEKFSNKNDSQRELRQQEIKELQKKGKVTGGINNLRGSNDSTENRQKEAPETGLTVQNRKKLYLEEILNRSQNHSKTEVKDPQEGIVFGQVGFFEALSKSNDSGNSPTILGSSSRKEIPRALSVDSNASDPTSDAINRISSSSSGSSEETTPPASPKSISKKQEKEEKYEQSAITIQRTFGGFQARRIAKEAAEKAEKAAEEEVKRLAVEKEAAEKAEKAAEEEVKRLAAKEAAQRQAAKEAAGKKRYDDDKKTKEAEKEKNQAVELEKKAAAERAALEKYEKRTKTGSESATKAKAAREAKAAAKRQRLEAAQPPATPAPAPAPATPPAAAEKAAEKAAAKAAKLAADKAAKLAVIKEAARLAAARLAAKEPENIFKKELEIAKPNIEKAERLKNVEENDLVPKIRREEASKQELDKAWAEANNAFKEARGSWYNDNKIVRALTKLKDGYEFKEVKDPSLQNSSDAQNNSLENNNPKTLTNGDMAVIYKLALGSDRYEELLKTTKYNFYDEDRFDVSKIEIEGDDLKQLNNFKEFIQSEQFKIGNESQKIKEEYFEFEGVNGVIESLKNINFVIDNNKERRLATNDEKNQIEAARKDKSLFLEEVASTSTSPTSSPSSVVQPKSYQLLRKPTQILGSLGT